MLEINGYEIKPGADLRNADLRGANLEGTKLVLPKCLADEITKKHQYFGVIE